MSESYRYKSKLNDSSTHVDTIVVHMYARSTDTFVHFLFTILTLSRNIQLK